MFYIGVLETANEALAMQFAAAALTGGNYIDDLLAITQLFSKQHLYYPTQFQTVPMLQNGDVFMEHIASEMYRMHGINVDHAMDPHPDPQFKLPLPQRCLNVQVALGYFGDDKPRARSSMLAWAIVNIRYISVILAYYCNRGPGIPPALQHELRNPGWPNRLRLYGLSD